MTLASSLVAAAFFAWSQVCAIYCVDPADPRTGAVALSVVEFECALGGYAMMHNDPCPPGQAADISRECEEKAELVCEPLGDIGA